MWWSEDTSPPAGAGRAVRPLAVLAVLAVAGPAGCGFHPLYGRHQQGPGADMAGQMATIAVDPIDDRVGQRLRNLLVERLTPQGEPDRPTYHLSVKLAENVVGLAHAQDGTASLGEIDLDALYTLADQKDHGTSGKATAHVDTDFLGPRYASISSQRDAEDQAISQLAEQIVGQVAVYLAHPDSRPPVGAVTDMPGTPRYQILQGPPTSLGAPGVPGAVPMGTQPQ